MLRWMSRATFALLLVIGSLTPAKALAQATDSLQQVLETVDQMRTEGEFQSALDRLQALRDQHPSNVEILWRLARTKVDIGEQVAETNENRMERLYQEALDDATRAIEADTTNAHAHLAVAIAAGRVGLISGTREKVRQSRTVKEHVDRAIELDSTLAAAHHVRGRWNHEVASLGFFSRSVVRLVYGGLPDASYEAAVRNFKKSIELDDRVIDRLELARTYIEMDREDLAKQHLQMALELPNKDPDDPQYKEEARELLEELR